MAMPPIIRPRLDQRPPRRAVRGLALAALLVAACLGGCSTVPDAAWPLAVDGQLEVVYHFADGAPRVFRVPSSDDQLTVRWLEADPPVVAERFVDGGRLWIAPPQLDELKVRFGYRLWGRGQNDRDGGIAADCFPGAQVLRHESKLVQD